MDMAWPDLTRLSQLYKNILQRLNAKLSLLCIGKVDINKPNLAMEKGHKAGLEGLDEEKINKVMEEATKGSKFYAKKIADQARTSEQV